MNKATSISSRLLSGGLTVSEISSPAIYRKIDWRVISDFLDVIVIDFLKQVPELLDPGCRTPVTPSELKLFLTGLVVGHLREHSGLMWSSGINVPKIVGMPVPVPLYAFLSYMSKYTSGNTVCRPQFVLTTEPAIVNDGLTVGTPVTSQVDLSSFATLGIFQVSQREFVMKTVAALGASVGLNAFWQAKSEYYAQVFTYSGYNCLPYPELAMEAPDASFYSFITTGAYTGGGTVTSDCVMVNHFSKWDPEIAQLYFRMGQGTDSAVCTNTARLIPASLPLDLGESSGAAANFDYTYVDLFVQWKASFVFIMRNCVYKPLDNLSKTKNYYGENLKTFAMTMRPLRIYSWREAIWRVLSEINKTRTGAQLTPNAATLFAYLVLCDVTVFRRLAQYCPSISFKRGSTVYNTVISAPPGMTSELQIPAVLAQFVNDLGPVVSRGQLIVPVHPFMTNRWYDDRGLTDTTSRWFGSALSFTTAPTAADITFRDQTVNTAWVVAQNGVTCISQMICPFVSLNSIYEIVRQFLTDGSGYGRGEFIYPLSSSPRGGAVMLTLALDRANGGAVSTPLQYLPGGGVGAQVAQRPCDGLTSGAPISSLELTMAYLEGWVAGTMEIDYTQNIQNNRYSFVLNEMNNGSLLIGRLISEVFTPGGVFSIMLAKAMHKRHTPDNDLGIVGANDDLDTCLWDTIKSVVGTVSGALKPMVPAVGIGCNLFAPGTGGFCTSVAKGLLDVADNVSQIGTNRHEVSNKNQELGKISRAVTDVTNASVDLPRYNRYDRSYIRSELRNDYVERQKDRNYNNVQHQVKQQQAGKKKRNRRKRGGNKGGGAQQAQKKPAQQNNKMHPNKGK
jgi:hypothetical protein